MGMVEKEPPEIPLLIVGFNRPHLISQIISAIRDEKPRVVFFAQDGPRPGHVEDQRLCNETHLAIQEVDWDCELVTLISTENMGTKQRLTSAVQHVLREFESVIILEDDCIPTKGFIRWGSQMSSHLESNKDIGMISGNRFDRIAKTCTLSKFPRTWGWITNRTNWNGFDPSRAQEPKKLRQAIAQNVKNPFARRHWNNRYREAVSDRHMWDVQWTIHLWMKNKKTLLPPYNLVSNRGVGHAATHTVNPSLFLEWPTPVMLNPDDPCLHEVSENVRHGIEPILLRLEALIGTLNRIGALRLSTNLTLLIRRLIARTLH